MHLWSRKSASLFGALSLSCEDQRHYQCLHLVRCLCSQLSIVKLIQLLLWLVWARVGH